eukprot:5130085-Amphidinium_carterae.1
MRVWRPSRSLSVLSRLFFIGLAGLPHTYCRLAHRIAQSTTHTVSLPEEELVLRDLATRLDARQILDLCFVVIWHLLAGHVPELHGGAIVRQAEPRATLFVDTLCIRTVQCWHHCAAA